MNTVITILLCVVMLASLVGMLICNKKQQTNPNAQGIAMLLLLVVIASGGYLLYHTNMLAGIGIGMSESDKIRLIERDLYASQGWVTADYLKEKGLANGKVLILADEGYETSERFAAFKDQLIAGGIPESNIEVDMVLEPAPKPEGGAAGPGGAPMAMMGPMMPMMMRMSASDFDKCVKKHADVKVVITLVGIPMNDGANLSFIKGKKKDDAAKLVVIGSVASPEVLAYGLVNSNVLAVSTPRKDADYEIMSLPSAQPDIFAERFTWYTEANASSLGR